MPNPNVDFGIWWVAGFLLLPMYFANGAPVIANRIVFLKGLGIPLSERLLGTHKTLRGLVAGMVGGWLAIAILFLIAGSYSVGIFQINLPVFLVFSVFGVWLGLGALIGDALKSFVKRKIKIPPGKPWVPFDQIDFIFGGFIFYIVSPFRFFQQEDVAAVFVLALLITPLLHLMANIVAYKLGWKKVWW